MWRRATLSTASPGAMWGRLFILAHIYTNARTCARGLRSRAGRAPTWGRRAAPSRTCRAPAGATNAVRHVATQCSMLQCSAACCNTAKFGETQCGKLQLSARQGSATSCNTYNIVRRSARQCNIVQHVQHVAMQCNIVRSSATHCILLQHVQHGATQCNSVQCSATSCKRSATRATWCNALHHCAKQCDAVPTRV
jgi:hypothetical protein